MNLCLGTVQFGIDYGIRGRRKPPVEESVAILNYAVTHGVDALDTSALYGDAEVVVGRFLEHSPVPRKNLYLVSKFGVKEFENLSASECERRLADVAKRSLERIGSDYLDAYICHVADAVRDPRIIRAMVGLKGSGITQRVGFSVYEIADAEMAIKTGEVDFLQLPLSILDQRMAQSGILDFAAEHKTILHARSVYVQGLALMQSDEVPDYLCGIRPKIAELERLCADTGVSRRALALAFVRRFGQISNVVIGVHDMQQLVENIDSFGRQVPSDVIDAACRIFSDVDSVLVMPNKWRR